MRAASVSLALITSAVLMNPASIAKADVVTIAELRSRYPENIVAALLEEKGVVLPRGDDHTEGFRALVVFDEPPGHVMRLLSQSARQTEYRPELREIELVGRHEGRSIEQHRLRIAFVNIVYRVSTRVDFERSRIAWNLDDRYDNGVTRIEGYWKIDELADGRSLGHFATIVDVGAALPDFLENAITAKLLPSTLENTRRWVDSNGRYRP